MECLNQLDCKGAQGGARGVKGAQGDARAAQVQICSVGTRWDEKIENLKFCTLFWVDKSRKQHAQLPLVNIGFSQ